MLPTEGESALRRAIRGGFAEIVRLLLAHHADPDAAPPPKVVSPEEKAQMREQMRTHMEKIRQSQAAFGIEEEPNDEDTDVESLFADDGPEPEPKPDPMEGKWRCLLLAIGSRDAKTVETLLTAGFSPNPPPGKSNPISPLDFAATCGAGPDIVRLLISHGVDPNGDGELTPLMGAVMRSDVPYAKLLIEAGARPDGGTFGMSLLAFALNLEKPEMAEFLVEQGVGLDDPLVDILLNGKNWPDLTEKIQRSRGTEWLSLVRAGDTAGVEAALRDGADVRVRDQNDGTALSLAIKAGDAAMVRVLLQGGADVAEASDYGVTALHLAAREGAVEIIDLLLEYGASPTTLNRFGRTPLLDAAVHGNGDAADRLIAGGATLGVVEAILLKRSEIADRLWEDGTPVDYAGDSGVTPLHAAASLGDLELAEELLDRGAAIEAVDKSGSTPLLCAVQKENEAIVSLLLDRGANPVGGGPQFDSPVYLAAVLLRNPGITRLLLQRGASLQQSLPGTVVSQMEEKIAAEADPVKAKILRDVLEKRERSTQFLPTLLSFHKIAKESEYPVHLAPDAKWRQTDKLWAVVEILLEFGASVDEVDTDGSTPLCSLIAFGAPVSLIRSVIDRGARVNPTERSRQSPLMLAVEQGRADIVRVLLEAGANPNGGVSAQSPLEAARATDLPEVAALLEAAGASEEKRTTMMADLGDDARFFFALRPEPNATGAISVPVIDFAGYADSQRADRAAKVRERRAQIAEEVARSMADSP